MHKKKLNGRIEPSCKSRNTEAQGQEDKPNELTRCVNSNTEVALYS